MRRSSFADYHSAERWPSLRGARAERDNGSPEHASIEIAIICQPPEIFHNGAGVLYLPIVVDGSGHGNAVNTTCGKRWDPTRQTPGLKTANEF